MNLDGLHDEDIKNAIARLVQELKMLEECESVHSESGYINQISTMTGNILNAFYFCIYNFKHIYNAQQYILT